MTTDPAPHRRVERTEPAPLRVLLSDAIGYREVRRLACNAFLAAVILAWVTFTWPRFRVAFAWQSMASLALESLGCRDPICRKPRVLLDRRRNLSVDRLGQFSESRVFCV